MKITEPPVVVEQRIPGPPERVWDALTVRDIMIQWYFDNIPAFDPVVGFETSFPVVSGDRTFTHLWRVTDVVTGRQIAYNWKYAEYPGDSYVQFDVEPGDNETIVRITVTVTQDFPDTIPEFKRESCIAGWEYFIGERLYQFAMSSEQ